MRAELTQITQELVHHLDEVAMSLIELPHAVVTS